MRSAWLGTPPLVLGWDVSDVVEATGYGVIFRLGDAAEAHKAGETGHVAGKLVFRVVP